MPLDTSSKRRSSVSILQPWQATALAPTDSPGVVDAPDREHVAWSYSGILATGVVSTGAGPAFWRPFMRPRRRA